MIICIEMDVFYRAQNDKAQALADQEIVAQQKYLLDSFNGRKIGNLRGPKTCMPKQAFKIFEVDRLKARIWNN
jgi:hypothetical protein